MDYKLVADPAARTKRIVFLNPANGTAALSRSGTWRLTIKADVANRFGRTLSADQHLDFNFLAADANNDGAVNFTDLVAVSQHYDMTTTNPDAPRIKGDLNCDGVIDFKDLALLSQMYDDVLA